MAQIALQVQAQGFQEIGEAIRRLVANLQSPKGLMSAIGKMVVSQTKRRFQAHSDPEGKAWPPKLPIFAAWEGGKNIPLTYTGALMQSIVHREPDDLTTEIGSPLPYAARHQFGGPGSKPAPFWILPEPGAADKGLPAGKLVLRQTPGARLIFMNINIRPRPFLGLGDRDMPAILEVVQAYLAKMLPGFSPAGAL